MIELNKPYTNKFIAEQLFHVRPNTFSKKKQQYLEHLGKYYQYEITDKKKIILKKQLQQFKTKMQVRQEITREMNEISEKTYKDLTHQIIFCKPLNSGSNIAREICDKHKNVFNHSQGTVQNKVRPILRTDFEVINKKWCGVDYSTNTYVPLTEEQMEFLARSFKEVKVGKDAMDLAADRDCGNISREEYESQVGEIVMSKYNKIMEAFKKQFKFRPYKVPNWREKTPLEEQVKKVVRIG